MDKTQFLIWVSLVLFSIGLLGLIVRRNLLVMLMCMELMLNGVNLSLVTFAQRGGSVEGAVMVFLIFIVGFWFDRLSAVMIARGHRGRHC
jgi:NADH-quinone oxidoreductase subunit K